MLHKRFQTWQHLPDYGATGGADAKIIIALVLFFAKRLLFIPIVLVGGLQGLIGLITSSWAPASPRSSRMSLDDYD